MLPALQQVPSATKLCGPANATSFQLCKHVRLPVASVSACTRWSSNMACGRWEQQVSKPPKCPNAWDMQLQGTDTQGAAQLRSGNGSRLSLAAVVSSVATAGAAASPTAARRAAPATCGGAGSS